MRETATHGGAEDQNKNGRNSQQNSIHHYHRLPVKLRTKVPIIEKTKRNRPTAIHTDNNQGINSPRVCGAVADRPKKVKRSLKIDAMIYPLKILMTIAKTNMIARIVKITSDTL